MDLYIRNFQNAELYGWSNQWVGMQSFCQSVVLMWNIAVDGCSAELECHKRVFILVFEPCICYTYYTSPPVFCASMMVFDSHDRHGSSPRSNRSSAERKELYFKWSLEPTKPEDSPVSESLFWFCAEAIWWPINSWSVTAADITPSPRTWTQITFMSQSAKVDVQDNMTLKASRQASPLLYVSITRCIFTEYTHTFAYLANRNGSTQ